MLPSFGLTPDWEREGLNVLNGFLQLETLEPLSPKFILVPHQPREVLAAPAREVMLRHLGSFKLQKVFKAKISFVRYR